MQEQQKKRKPWALAALAVLLVALAVGGTYAWLTASNKVTNTFTVGQITKPDPDKKPTPDKPDPDPTEPHKPLPDPNKPGSGATLNGNIYEIFTPDSLIVPGSSVKKAPYVGIGAKSQNSYAFAYVANNMMAPGADAAHSAYFTLGTGWKPVEGSATKYTGAGATANTYSSGLFVWCGAGSTPVALQASKDKAVWTGKLFDQVVTPAGANANDFKDAPSMDVWCYLYGATGDAASSSTAAVSAAKEWAKSPAVVEGTAKA